MAAQIDRRTLSLILSEHTHSLAFDSFSPADWDLLVDKSQREGVAPLVYRTLSRSGDLSRCPAEVQARLRAMYVSLSMNNEELLKELEILSGLFERARIPVVALKGVCFALTLYPETGLRPMVDLDLLVPAPQVAEAVRIARSSGYEDAAPEASSGLDELLNHAVCLKKTTAPFTTLELHTTLVAEGSFKHAIPVDWFWSQVQSMEGITSERNLDHLRMLTPTAQLLYACAHAMLQHGGRNTSLRWLYDLDRLIRRYAERIDWDLLLTQARIFEWSSASSAALAQVARLFDTAIPPGVLDDLSKQSDRNTERIIALQDHPATHTLEEYQKLRSLHWQGRFRLALALVVPSPAYMRWRYGLKVSWALPVYYLYRWWGILKDAIKTVVLLVPKVIPQAGHRNTSR